MSEWVTVFAVLARPMAGLGRWWWFTEGESGGSDVGLDDGMLTVRIPLSLSL